MTNAQSFSSKPHQTRREAQRSHKQNLDMENMQFVVLQTAISSLHALGLETFPDAGSTRTNALEPMYFAFCQQTQRMVFLLQQLVAFAQNTQRLVYHVWLAECFNFTLQ